MRLFSILISFAFVYSLQAVPPGYWQQQADYTMEVVLDDVTHQYRGFQTLEYYNNSPDTLYNVYYHLYFNAFRPGSSMDIRNQLLPDPDRRVGDRISELKPHEEGFLNVITLTMNGAEQIMRHVETILEVDLSTPILPGTRVVFEMEFEGQVPVQIRRAGRNNREGIAYSMAQWYPKMCQYDDLGWHAHPYIGREFYGIFGTFDVKLTLDGQYTVAATGVLQNPEETGHGYDGDDMRKPAEGEMITWHFIAEQVHDFAWSADKEYIHVIAQVPDGPVLRFFYREGNQTTAWSELPGYMVTAFQFMSKHYGFYPYPEFVTSQGGDGGMEYPMFTLITGNRRLASLVGVTVHEALHMWYYGVLATNESLYPWMDEGFTTWASNVVMKHLFDPESDRDPQYGNYIGYLDFIQTGEEEPLSTHADHFNTNRAFGVAAYTKGALFLHQLEYIVGKETFDRGMLRYYNEWKFKHPKPYDFIRVMEKESRMDLDWYYRYWIYTTHYVDYGFDPIFEAEDGTAVARIIRYGLIPMPLAVMITLDDGRQIMYNIPIDIQRGHKPAELDGVQYIKAPIWPWVEREYYIYTGIPYEQVVLWEIDPSRRLIDVDPSDNVYPPVSEE